MSVVTRSSIISAIVAGTVVPALAAVEGRNPSGDIAVWIFLGFCALIIVAQVITMIGQVRKQATRAIEHAKQTEQVRETAH
jgi:hypothetical protein